MVRNGVGQGAGCERIAFRFDNVVLQFPDGKEIVKDKVTGFLINPFNIEEVEKRIKELLDDRLKAERFGKAGGLDLFATTVENLANSTT